MLRNEFRLRRYGALLAFALLMFGSSYATAQDMNSLHGRLAPLPVTGATVKTITGQGQITGTLSGSTLTIDGSFEGMSSPATMAHIHLGPKAIPGPVILRLDVSAGSSGTVSGTLTLNPEQISALHSESLYVQIHSETNPEGELRGWLTH